MEINKLFFRSSLFLIFILLFSSSYAQKKELKGIVYDDVTKKPLESVVVYLNGTTKGTITNTKGKFYLELNTASSESLIISYLGYRNVTLDQSEIEDNDNIIVYLKEQLELLDPVFLENDDWSREKKMHYFKMNFIGSKELQKNCIILNEDDINLFYSTSKKILYASAYVPIKIRNNLFGYSISYDLMDFEVEFKHKKGAKPIVKSVFFMGNSFFKEFEDIVNTQDDKLKYVRRRKNAYNGSVVHFMRSLATNTLKKNRFELIYRGKKVEPEAHFKVSMQNGFANVLAEAEKISIIYDKTLRSSIMFKSQNTSFNIDSYGNFGPVKLFQFDGYMGRLKVGKMLPLDYGLE